MSATGNHYDALETREPAEREAALFARLPEVLRRAMAAPPRDLAAEMRYTALVYRVAQLLTTVRGLGYMLAPPGNAS